VFPFITRDEAELHFREWLRTLRRWKGIETSEKHELPVAWNAEIPATADQEPDRPRSMELRLHQTPIELKIPVDSECFRILASSAWHVELWDAEDEMVGGMCGSQRHFDIGLNLRRQFRELEQRHGGQHGARCDVLLADDTAVQPDFVYYGPSRENCLIAEAYFQGPPNLVAEVLSPASVWADRGERQRLYARAGVRELWLIDPQFETVKQLALRYGQYELKCVHYPGDRIELSCFPGEAVSAAELFDTQWKQQGRPTHPRRPIPQWLVPEEIRVGLEHLLLMGHHDRRHEIWSNRAPCVLPFGSEAEAKQRFGDVLTDICRWEARPFPRDTKIDRGRELAEVGRFRLTRRYRKIMLEVAVDARKYEQLARIWHQRGVWKWDEV
jgi:Uma2 family endonuclease